MTAVFLMILGEGKGSLSQFAESTNLGLMKLNESCQGREAWYKWKHRLDKHNVTLSYPVKPTLGLRVGSQPAKSPLLGWLQELQTNAVTQVCHPLRPLFYLARFLAMCRQLQCGITKSSTVSLGSLLFLTRRLIFNIPSPEEPSMKLLRNQTEDLTREGARRLILCLKTFSKVCSTLKFRQM